MIDSPVYKIEWGKSGRTIVYQDSGGLVTFGLDGSAKGAHWMTLEHHGIYAPLLPNYEIAFKRAKQYLESRGYQVEIYGQPPEGKPLPPDVQSFTYEDARGKLIFHFEVVSNRRDSDGNPAIRFKSGSVFTSDGKIFKCTTSEERERFSSALAKVKNSLQSKGYQVEIPGD